MKSVGQVIFAFFEDYLKTQKGLRPGSIRSYRDTLKLFLAYVASNCRRPITRLVLSDLSAQRVLDFLQMIEVTRGNRVSTRNQRLAALHTFYRYAGLQYPEMLAEAQRVEAIPMKRSAPPQTDTWSATKSRLCSRACRAKEPFRSAIGLSSWSSITPERGCRRSPTSALPM